MRKYYSKLLDALEVVEKAVLAIFLTLMVVLMVYQVVLRYIFSAANAWNEELVRYLFIYSVMIASAVAARRNSHLQVDVFINYLKPKMKCLFTVAATVLGIVFLIFLFRYSLDLCWSARTNMSAGLGISMTIPYLCIPIGCLLITLTSLEVICKQIVTMRSYNELNQGGGS